MVGIITFNLMCILFPLLRRSSSRVTASLNGTRAEFHESLKSQSGHKTNKQTNYKKVKKFSWCKVQVVLSVPRAPTCVKT